MAKVFGDRVYTARWVARDMVAYFSPTGRTLEPSKGKGVFMEFLPPETEWCEIDEGRDFFDWKEHVDWLVGNPPYSVIKKWFDHSFSIADNILYIFPLWRLLSGYGFVRKIYKWGGIVHIRIYGTGTGVGFPMGNAVGAVHMKAGYEGPVNISFAPKPQEIDEEG